MNRETERPREEDLADRLWRAITALQAMTGRLMAQHERTMRGRVPDAYSLPKPGTG